MTLLKKMALRSGVDWEKFQFFQAGAFGKPSQLPMNFTPGRIVIQANAKGISHGLPVNFGTGIAVFDFNESKQRYILSNFALLTDYWGYVLNRLGNAWAMVDQNTLLSVMDPMGPNTNTTPDINRCEIKISADPGATITFISPYAYAGNENCNYPERRSNPSIGYNGALLYGYFRTSRDGGYGTQNGWINKMTKSSFTAMSGALNTGFSGSEYGQGGAGINIAMLGFNSPNNYLIVNAERDDSASYCRWKLVDCNSVPVVVSEVTPYPGRHQDRIIPISATRAIAHDRTNASDISRLSLLYTNSATAPTTLNKGAECNVPSLLPAGAGFTADDVYYAGFNLLLMGQNYKSKENKVLVFIYWKLKSTAALANGDNNYSVYTPCIIEATSDTSLTATLTGNDVNGQPAVLLHHYTGHFYGNDDIRIVGAPDNKVVVMWLEPDGSNRLLQQTFQL